jgi:mono/diheme cytochrome c family protein
MHAFYALAGLGELDAETVKTALASTSRGLKRAALLVAPADETLSASLIKNGVVTAADDRELAETFVALARMASADEIGKALHAALLANEKNMFKDATLFAAWQAAARRHAAGLLAAAGEINDAPVAPVNLLKDPGFNGPGLGDWKLRIYGAAQPDSVQVSISPGGRNGSTALKITSPAPADAGAGIDIAVTPNSRYRFGGWIRTDDHKATGGRGAMFNQHQGPTSESHSGTRDWKEFSFEFETGNQTSVLLHCLFGGYGSGTGTAFYDDVYLHELGSGGINYALSSVAKHHAESSKPAAPVKEMVRKNVPVPAVHERGFAIYNRTCIACHGADGKGVPGTFPPLDGADWATGDPSVPTRIVLAGLQGPIEVAGQKFNNIMPPHTDLKDAEIADVLTYVRQTWSNDATPVAEDFVKQIRQKYADRKTPWTAEELKK